MAIPHGQKLYIQILLDPNRADLLKRQAADKGVKLTAHIRDLLYQSLERSEPSSTYNEAFALDQAVWRSSIKNRVAGKKAAREKAKEEAADEVLAEIRQS